MNSSSQSSPRVQAAFAGQSNASRFIKKREAKARYHLTDEHFEAIRAVSGAENDPNAIYNIWAVLQLTAAVRAGLRYDDAITRSQAMKRFGLQPQHLDFLVIVARVSNPVHGGVVVYYNLHDVETVSAAVDDPGLDVVVYTGRYLIHRALGGVVSFTRNPMNASKQVKLIATACQTNATTLSSSSRSIVISPCLSNCSTVSGRASILDSPSTQASARTLPISQSIPSPFQVQACPHIAIRDDGKLRSLVNWYQTFGCESPLVP